MSSITLITSPQDDILLPWLDLYESAFPYQERVPVSVILGCLKGSAKSAQVLALLDDEDAFAGLAIYDLPAAAEGRLAFLWFLATLPELRGQGLGAWLYRGILARLPRTVEALIFDVEIPELAGGPREQELARRRIAFYRRLGARLVAGIRYQTSAGPDRPRLALHLMAHPRTPSVLAGPRAEIAAAEVCALVRAFMPDALEIMGEVAYA